MPRSSEDGGHHRAQLALRHRRLDPAALRHVQAAVMQRDRQRRFVQPPQRLEHQLGLGAGVDEDDRHAGGADARQDVGRAVQPHVARPGQPPLRQHHRQSGGAPSVSSIIRSAPDIGRKRARMRHGRRQPDAPCRRRQRAEPRETERQAGRPAWCRRAHAPRRSPPPAGRRTSPARRAATAAAPGSRAWSAAGSAAVRCWRWRLDAGVSPVRVSMPIGRRISSTGRGQVARDVGGERLQRADIERVQPGARRLGEVDQATAGTPPASCRRRWARSAARDSPARAAASIASWCRRSVQPRAANQAAKGSGNVPSTRHK